MDTHGDYPFRGRKAHPNDLNGLRRYTEWYTYDAVGNFVTFKHEVAEDGWTRHYHYNEESLIESNKVSNRLSHTTVGNGETHDETYSYVDDQNIDSQGCMTAINNQKMVWDFEDQLQKVDLGGGGTAFYVYDAEGQRVKKVIENQNSNLRKERIYLGNYEIYREYVIDGDAPALERETLHVMDDEDRIALVETQTVKDSKKVIKPTSLQRFQLNNHLGSASVELNGEGGLISYEEYHPYGTTAFQTRDSVSEVSLKRYRYSGKERDDEMGLYYFGARYFSPGIGIWISADPAGTVDGTNLFVFVRRNPICQTDRVGFVTGRSIERDKNKREVVKVSPTQSYSNRVNDLAAYLESNRSLTAPPKAIVIDRTVISKNNDNQKVTPKLKIQKKGTKRSFLEDKILGVGLELDIGVYRGLNFGLHVVIDAKGNVGVAGTLGIHKYWLWDLSYQGGAKVGYGFKDIYGLAGQAESEQYSVGTKIFGAAYTNENMVKKISTPSIDTNTSDIKAPTGAVTHGLSAGVSAPGFSLETSTDKNQTDVIGYNWIVSVKSMRSIIRVILSKKKQSSEKYRELMKIIKNNPLGIKCSDGTRNLKGWKCLRFW